MSKSEYAVEIAQDGKTLIHFSSEKDARGFMNCVLMAFKLCPPDQQVFWRLQVSLLQRQNKNAMWTAVE